MHLSRLFPGNHPLTRPRWRQSDNRMTIICFDDRSVHIHVIAAKISRDCSHINANVAQFTLIIVTSPNAERKFGLSVSRSPSLRSKKFDGRMGTRQGGLLTSTEEHRAMNPEYKIVYDVMGCGLGDWWQLFRRKRFLGFTRWEYVTASSNRSEVVDALNCEIGVAKDLSIVRSAH